MRTLLFLVFFLCAFAVCHSAAQRQRPATLSIDREDYPQLFQDWKATFGKTYASDNEESLAFAKFILSINRARTRNLETNSNSHGLSPFSDLSPEEFADRYLMKSNVLDYLRANADQLQNLTMDSLEEGMRLMNPGGERIRSEDGEPATGPWVPNKLYDWKHSGFVSPVKDQGQCGSCWAFSATEQIESNFAMVHGHLPANLSEQQIVDCDTDCYGCGGGWPGSAYDYIKNIGGQESNTLYPYTATDGTCHDSGSKIVHVTGYKVVGQAKESAMLQWVAKTGPLSICLDATSLQDYAGNGALLLASSCDPNNINHCTQLTGFKANANGYIYAWNMRNSWGTWWGNNGYALLQYGHNTCGLTSFPTSALVS